MLYSGLDLNLGPVSLSLPDPREIENAVATPDMVEVMTQWLQRAIESQDTLYFSIRLDGMLAGQIFLYDLGVNPGEARVGLHLFDPAMRGRGVGPAALALLQQYASEQAGLKRLVFVVSANERAALRAAEKCGFAPAGPPGSDPFQVVYTWDAPAG